MSFYEQLVLVLAVLVALVLVTINFFFWKNWYVRKDHVYRTCGLEREFSLRKDADALHHQHGLEQMTLNHKQTMERDQAIREGSHTGVGGYS